MIPFLWLNIYSICVLETFIWFDEITVIIRYSKLHLRKRQQCITYNYVYICINI